ncbi:MAG TPA: fasciclin domain-containing protein [Gammaproteobacteria bacterium]|nr:fasciclin domain-containing protein [Gammaproteobacteria bacterium]
MERMKLWTRFTSVLLLGLAGLALVSFGAHAVGGKMKSEHNIVAVLQSAGQYTTLLKALDAAGLTATLEGRGRYTLFAPNDEAFAKLPAGKLDELLKPENKAELVSILKYHVLPRKLPSHQLVRIDSPTHMVKTLEGKSVTIRSDNNQVMVNDAKVITADIKANNGVIHEIDTVLMPPA